MRKLIARCRQGDTTAVEQLIGRFYGWSLRYANSLLNDAHLAEDAVQEALVHAIGNLNTLRSDAAFAPWLRQIIRTRANRILRQRRDLPIDDGIVIPGDQPDPQTRIETEELRTIVAKSVAQLPAAQGETVVEYYFREHSVLEISRRLGIPKGTVRRRLHDARKRLGGILSANGLPAASSGEEDPDGKPVRRTPIV